MDHQLFAALVAIFGGVYAGQQATSSRPVIRSTRSS